MEEQIKPIYEELKGILTQTPQESKHRSNVSIKMGESFNERIGALEKITGLDLSRFYVKPRAGISVISLITYRQNLNGLINFLRVKYLPDEPEPFGGTPQNVMTQNLTINYTRVYQISIAISFAVSLAVSIIYKIFFQ